MTPDEIKRVVVEIERRWRERTPFTRVDEVNASYRVGRSEIRSWCAEQGIKIDETDEDFQAAATRMYMNLRREFPDEKWDHLGPQTKELCKKYGIVIPRMRKSQ